MKRPLPTSSTASSGAKRQSCRLVLKLENAKKKYAEDAKSEDELKNDVAAAVVADDKENHRNENEPAINTTEIGSDSDDSSELTSVFNKEGEKKISELERRIDGINRLNSFDSDSYDSDDSSSDLTTDNDTSTSSVSSYARMDYSSDALTEDNSSDYDSDDSEDSWDSTEDEADFSSSGQPTPATPLAPSGTVVQSTPISNRTLVSTDVKELLPANIGGSIYRRLIGRDDFFYSISSGQVLFYLKSNLNLSEVRLVALATGVSRKKRITKIGAAVLLSNHAERLKREYRIEEFNALVDCINRTKPAYDRLPYLPPVVSAISILNRSLQIASRFTRPQLPFQFQEAAGIIAITGAVFLDAADLDYYCTDFFFEIPRQFEAEREILVCLYRCDVNPNQPTIPQIDDSNYKAGPLWNTRKDSNYNFQSSLCTTEPRMVRADCLDLILNGEELSRRKDLAFDITLLCKRNEPNRLRCIKLPFAAFQVTNLVLEIIGIIPRTPLSQSAVTRAPAQITAPNQNSFGYACLQGDPELKDRQWVLKMLKPTQSDDIAIADDSITIDLRCPISLGRIRRPVRFTQCKHPQCFDYDVFKQFAQAGLTKSKDVKCPVCFVSMTRSAKLIECGLIKDILAGHANLTKVKIDLNTGIIAQNDTGNGITLASSDDDEGSDGENGLRLAMQQSSAVSIPETIVPHSNKSFTFIDLCASDEENHPPQTNRDSNQIIFIS